MRKTGYLFRACYSREAATITCICRDLAGRGMTELHSGEKGRLHVCADCRLLAWEAGGGLSRRQCPYVVG